MSNLLNWLSSLPASRILGLLCATLTALSAGRSFADESANIRAYTGATILTAAGDEFAPGTLIVEDGKIQAVGAAANVEIPDDAEQIDLSGKLIIPGLVDSHSHLGVYSRPGSPGNADGNESTGPVQSIVRALDSLNPYDPGIRMAVAGGVTTANIMPGSANVIGGQTIYVKLRGTTPERMWFGPDEPLGGLKMANGENPKRSYGSRGQAPDTRMKVAALQRAEFIKAQSYQRKWDDYRKKQASGEEASPPDVDLAMEPLVEVLNGKRTVHFHTHRADDILTTLRLKDEFHFDLVIQHGTEAYKVLEQIAAHDVPVSMTILDSPGGKAEVTEFIEQTGAELVKAGVKVLINTDDPVTESRILLRTAAIAHRGGMSETETLKAITINPAEAMQLQHRVGSLEPGKDADFVVLSGRPFSVYTRVLQTYIDGKREFDLAADDEFRFQTGGFALRDKQLVPHLDELVEPESLPEVAYPNDSEEVTDETSEFLVAAARIYPVSSEPVDQQVVHIQDGRIVAVGSSMEIDPDGKLPVLAAATVTPGLIDAHSMVPLTGEYNISADQDANEKSGTNQADVRVLDAFHPSEPLLRFLLQNGITVVHVCPGRENVIGGLTGTFRTTGRSADEMVIKFPQAMLINLGNAPKEAYSGSPDTRMGTAAVLRQAYNEAVNYHRNETKAKEKGDVFDRDLKKEYLALTLNGELPALFSAHRADDLGTALRISEEFHLQPMIAVGTEAYLIRETLASQKVPVIVHPTMQRVDDLETFNSTFRNAALLADAHVQIAIGTGFESYVPKTRVVRHEAAMAMTYGLGHARALHSVTLGAAKILGIDQDYGSLSAGKVADLVLYDGDPFEHTTHVQAVIVGGRVVYRRSDDEPIPLAERMQYMVPEIPCCTWW